MAKQTRARRRTVAKKPAHAKRPYLQVFAALAVLTLVEVGVAGMAVDQSIRIFILLALAATKAALVALFYMHLRYDHRLLAIVGSFPLLLVAFLLIILLADRSIGG